MPRSALLQNQSFMAFFASRIATTMAIQMMMVAVGYQMYDITHSAWDLGMVGLLQFLPALLLTLVVGQVADSFDRRRIMGVCYVAQAIVGVLLVWASLGGWVGREVIFAASVALGTARAFQLPTQQAVPPMLVEESILPQALAFNSGGMQFAIISGPAIGGFVYVGGPYAVYAVCTVLFAFGALFLTRVSYLRQPTRTREPVSWHTLFAGVRYMRQNKTVLGATTLDLFAVLLGGATALLPIYARDILHTGTWGLGFLRAAPAVGALLTSIWLARHPIQRRTGKVMFGAVALYGVSTIIFGLSTNFLLSFVMLAISGVGDMISVVIRQSLVQLETPDEMRGRVSAVAAIFIGASNQLGEFESGVMAAAFGAVSSVTIGGIGTLAVVALWMKFFPQLTQRDRLQRQ